MQLPEITEEEKVVLLLALGMAAGTARNVKDPKLSRAIWRLANTLMAGQPNWIPFAVREETEDVG